jgi:hypothetical protein
LTDGHTKSNKVVPLCLGRLSWISRDGTVRH